MEKTIKYIKSIIDAYTPKTLVILGSGLGDLANEYGSINIDYSQIPNFKKSNVEGHKNKLIFTSINDQNVVFMQGRYHYYEGYSVKDIVFPIKVLRYLGAENLIITNASGGLNPNFKPGSLMLIEDHINFTGQNPLIGVNDEQFGPRFPDMTEVYDKGLREIAIKSSEKLNIKLEKGIYISVTGPSYETPAEIRMFRNFGADAVGMSTVNEAIYGNYCKMKVLGISCITNLASGLNKEKLSHIEVVKTANQVKEDFKKLLKEIIFNIS